MTKRLRWLSAVLLVTLVASACGMQAGVNTKELETVIRAYYDAVERDDAEGQAELWTSPRQEEARRLAQGWAKRSKEDLKVTSFHVESTEQPNVKIVHYYLSLKGQTAPEGKAALMEQVNGTWRLREIR